MKLTMHLDEARFGGRFSVFFATAAALFGVLGLISVAHADSASTPESSVAPATVSVREGVMTERLRDCVTFTREGSQWQGQDALDVVRSR